MARQIQVNESPESNEQLVTVWGVEELRHLDADKEYDYDCIINYHGLQKALELVIQIRDGSKVFTKFDLVLGFLLNPKAIQAIIDKNPIMFSFSNPPTKESMMMEDIYSIIREHGGIVIHLTESSLKDIIKFKKMSGT